MEKLTLSDDQKKRLKAAGTRAAWTVAQAALAAIGTATVMSEVDWRYVVSASALAGILSLLKSVTVGMPEVEWEVIPISPGGRVTPHDTQRIKKRKGYLP